MTTISLVALKELAQELFGDSLSGKDNVETLDLKTELNLDSFALLQFFSAIEDKFDIDLFSQPAEPGEGITLLTLLKVCQIAPATKA